MDVQHHQVQVISHIVLATGRASGLTPEN